MTSAPLPTITSRQQFGWLLTRLGLAGEAAEIGVAEGGFSDLILGSWPGVLHMINCWRHLDERDYHDCCNALDADQEECYRRSLAVAARYPGRAVVHRLFSAEAVSLFHSGQLNFAYIDANHAYAAIREDLRLWWPIVAPGGVFAGHDFLDGEIRGNTYGVKRAVSEFCAPLGLEVHVVAEEWPSWWVRKDRA